MGLDHKKTTKQSNNFKLPAPETQAHNRRIIKTLYKALAHGQTVTAAKLAAPDLEWWFHGPPHSNHMMRILTGESRQNVFIFKPKSIKGIGDRVIVEGWEGSKGYWVHVWTVKEGMITQFREYFNTWLTVIFRVSEDGDSIRLWESEPRERVKRSLPDLVLAI